MTRGEACNWLRNLRADVGKIEHKGLWHYEQALAEIIELLEEQPSIYAVKHGIWIEENTRTRSSKFYCSVCHRTAYDPQPTRIAGWVKRCRYAYCPNCGAKMDKEGDKK